MTGKFRGLVDADDLSRSLVAYLMECHLLPDCPTCARPPAPCERDAELVLLEALIAGRLSPTVAQASEPDDFAGQHARALAGLLLPRAREGRTVSRAELLANLEQACPGTREVWERFLDYIELHVPALVIPGALADCVTRVRAASRRRALLTALQKIDAGIRAGVLTDAEIYARGAEAFTPFRGSP